MSLIKHLDNKQHIIWDWNGTILNDVNYVVDVMNSVLKDQKMPNIDLATYKQIFEFPVKKYYDKLGFDYSKRSFEELCHDFVDRFMQGVHTCKPFEQIEGVLLNLKNIGKTQSVLSATDQPNLDHMVSHYGLRDIFQFVYGIEDKYARSKVARGQALLESATIAREETVMIGDTLHDLEVGEELGIDVILITHGHQCESILSKSHHTVLNVLL